MDLGFGLRQPGEDPPGQLLGFWTNLAGIDQDQDVVQVPVDVLRLELDADLGGAEALLADLLGDQPHSRQAQRVDRVVEDRQIDSGVDQGAEHHVAADARSTVQVGQFHVRGSWREMVRLADHALHDARRPTLV